MAGSKVADLDGGAVEQLVSDTAITQKISFVLSSDFRHVTDYWFSPRFNYPHGLRNQSIIPVN